MSTVGRMRRRSSRGNWYRVHTGHNSRNSSSSSGGSCRIDAAAKLLLQDLLLLGDEHLALGLALLLQLLLVLGALLHQRLEPLVLEVLPVGQLLLLLLAEERKLGLHLHAREDGLLLLLLPDALLVGPAHRVEGDASVARLIEFVQDGLLVGCGRGRGEERGGGRERGGGG